MTRIFIDADACPVRAETLKVADRHKLQVYVVSNGGIRPDPHPLVETVIVPGGPDVADMWIADRVGFGDICITGDIPLAARCIENGGCALKHNGEAFTQTNIGNALAMRNLMTDLRAANPLGSGGGSRMFSKADRSRFLDALDRLIRVAKKDAAGQLRS